MPGPIHHMIFANSVRVFVFPRERNSPVGIDQGRVNKSLSRPPVSLSHRTSINRITSLSISSLILWPFVILIKQYQDERGGWDSPQRAFCSLHTHTHTLTLDTIYLARPEQWVFCWFLALCSSCRGKSVDKDTSRGLAPQQNEKGSDLGRCGRFRTTIWSLPLPRWRTFWKGVAKMKRDVKRNGQCVLITF